MDYRLEIVNFDMDEDVYYMYQDIPKEEIGSTNNLNGCSFEVYKETLKEFKIEESILNETLNTTTNRYIFYVNGKPVGEIGIRTSLNDFWINKGSQLFYKIRLSERSKGYGTKMLELALIECKKLEMKRVRIN
jgi:predicted acetyltransferase